MTEEFKERAKMAFDQKLQMCQPKRMIHDAIPCRFSFTEMGAKVCVLHGTQHAHCPLYVEATRK